MLASLIVRFLEFSSSLIDIFEKNIQAENFKSKLVFVQNSDAHRPPVNHPSMYKRHPENVIYLSTKDRYWSQLSYQFAHEYCHHIIESNFINTFYRFAWFEESAKCIKKT